MIFLNMLWWLLLLILISINLVCYTLKFNPDMADIILLVVVGAGIFTAVYISVTGKINFRPKVKIGYILSIFLSVFLLIISYGKLDKWSNAFVERAGNKFVLHKRETVESHYVVFGDANPEDYVAQKLDYSKVGAAGILIVFLISNLFLRSRDNDMRR